MAKQPQALHFFNTAGFSRSEKLAYNEYVARYALKRPHELDEAEQCQI
jgi:hypothetical protein